MVQITHGLLSILDATIADSPFIFDPPFWVSPSLKTKIFYPPLKPIFRKADPPIREGGQTMQRLIDCQMFFCSFDMHDGKITMFPFLDPSYAFFHGVEKY